MSLASNISDALHGVPNGDGFVVQCPVHEDTNPSLSVKDITNNDGDPDIICECHAGCSWKDVKDELVSRGLLPEFDPKKKKNGQEYRSKTNHQSKESSSGADKPEQKSFPWSKAKPDAAKIQQYFSSRSIIFSDKFPVPPALKYNEYQNKKTGDTVRAIVCAATCPEDQAVYAVQRIFLDDEMRKTGTKMLGDIREKGRGVWFYRKENKEELIVGEGVETTLSSMQATGINGVAGLDTAKMQALQFPPETHTLYILTDQDKPPANKKAKGYAGQSASLALAESFEASSSLKENIPERKAYLITPTDSCFVDDVKDKLDFNDLLMMPGGEELIRARFEAKQRPAEVSWRPPEKPVKENNSNKDDDSDGSFDGGYYPDDTLDELEKINKQYAACLLGGKFRIIKESFDAAQQKHMIEFLEKGSFFDFYAHKKVFVETKDATKALSVAKCWHEWPDRRTYNNVVFSPGNNIPKTSYNLFRGFPINPVKGSWDKMLHHIQYILCDGNYDHTEYLLDWMARAVQDPGGKRPGVAVVLKGGKGVGKGIFANYFGKIFGEAFMPISSAQGFTGNFNMHLAKCLVVFLDEAVWGGDKQAEGKLKALITEPTMLFEPKGIDSMALCNYLNVIMASNEDWVCPASIDERRFFVLTPTDEHQQDIVYFNAIVSEMENGGVEAMYYDMMHRKYDLDKLRTSPKTAGLIEQVERTLDDIMAFWHSVLSRGFLLSEKDTGEPKLAMKNTALNEWPDAAWKYEIYHEFKTNFCNNKIHTPVEKEFFRRTWQFWKRGLLNQSRQSLEDGSRKFLIRLDGIDEMRKNFTSFTNINFNDENDENEIIPF